MIGAMIKAKEITKKYDISHVNTVLVGASNLSKEVASAIDSILSGCTTVQGYGLTETTVAVTLGNPLDDMFGSCGNLFPGCDARLIDDAGNDIEEHDRPGELLIRSPTVMLGYLDNDTETKAMFTDDGWLHTGDLVEFRKSSKGHDNLFIIDRIKELIKVRVSSCPLIPRLVGEQNPNDACRVCRFRQQNSRTICYAIPKWPMPPLCPSMMKSPGSYR